MVGWRNRREHAQASPEGEPGPAKVLVGCPDGPPPGEQWPLAVFGLPCEADGDCLPPPAGAEYRHPDLLSCTGGGVAIAYYNYASDPSNPVCHQPDPVCKGACLFDDCGCQVLKEDDCTDAGGQYQGYGSTCDDQVDLDADSDADGTLQGSEVEEIVEEDGLGPFVVVNDDDDNNNQTSDHQEDPVTGEDDLEEIRLSTTCVPDNPSVAKWSLSWSPGSALRVWQNPDKSGTQVQSGTKYGWDGPEFPGGLPNALYVEALSTGTPAITLNVYANGQTSVGNDALKLVFRQTHKVPLGGETASTEDPGFFKVYMPTKWGGKLDVATTSGLIEDLAYPDGTPYTNNTETGTDKHGWYTFKVTGSTSYTVSATFTQEGEAATRPWNFYWWSMKADYVYDGGNRTADTTAAPTDLQMVGPGSPTGEYADVVRSGTDGTLETTAAGDDQFEPMINLFDNEGTYQPLVKYDARHGTTARDWEAQYGQGTSNWHGHCLGGAMASILVNQPVPAAGSNYNAEELEGLWSELGEKSGIYDIEHGIDGIPAGPPCPGIDVTDPFIPRFHGLLEEWIKDDQVALQSNLRCEDCQHTCSGGTNDGGMCYTDADCPGGVCVVEVWNHAVYKFSAVYKEAVGGNERVVKITTSLFANRDHAPPTTDTADRELEYVYIIEYSTSGTADTGAAKDFIRVGLEASFAPSNLLHVVDAAWGGDNGQVTEANVRADDSAN
ncbi:MAG TPA: hypothetical protein VM243_02955 [Phycisphaerae bacterium]|nr:hypothetical protein [Phycisphaerae bacterium]